MINTGEKRLVLHQLTRGQLGDTVTADGVDKRAFYVEQQNKIADFANKVHAGEITNGAGEKFTTVVQIGIGGSDLGPRAMYLALENWAKKNNTFKMEAKFISNVDPDDAAAVLNSVDIAHSLFVLVSKSGTTLETLTNESFVKDALKNAGLDASKHMVAVTSETSPLAKSDDYLAAFFMDDYIGGRFSSHLQLAAQYCLWHLDRKYLHSSWKALQRKTNFLQTKIFLRTRKCWMHLLAYMSAMHLDIRQQQFFHIHRLSAASRHTFSRQTWSQTASL